MRAIEHKPVHGGYPSGSLGGDLQGLPDTTLPSSGIGFVPPGEGERVGPRCERCGQESGRLSIRPPVDSSPILCDLCHAEDDAWRGKAASPAAVMLDGDRVTPGTAGCVCTSQCEYPCWQRIGITTTPCCPGCAPLLDDGEGDG